MAEFLTMQEAEKQLLVATGDLQRPQDYWTAEICL